MAFLPILITSKILGNVFFIFKNHQNTIIICDNTKNFFWECFSDLSFNDSCASGTKFRLIIFPKELASRIVFSANFKLLLTDLGFS